MTFVFTRAWIALSALLVSAGWALSLVKQLNRTGYAVVLALVVIAAVPWVARMRRARPWRWAPLRRRFRRPLALAFLIFVVATALAGLLYAPNNYDALNYRVPRTLHWLAEGQWHWIHTVLHRMNTRTQGCEWTMAPLLLFAGSERLLWLANFFMFTALPGLIFVFLRGLGVRCRVAWQWMWLLPCGYCFLLQAGGISNDLPGVYFALAAFALALRARKSNHVGDLLFSALAIALSTGMKASNAPLALPWLVAAWPSLRLLVRRPLAALATMAVCVLVSFLPCAVLNIKYCGDWSGAKLESADLGAAPTWVLLFGNTAGLAIQNLTPPVFPVAPWWNQHVLSWLPGGVREPVMKHFESSGAILQTTELQIEEITGLGFGLSLMLVVAAVVAVFGRREGKGGGSAARAVKWALGLAALVYMSKMGINNAARVFAPYYPGVAALILAGRGQEALSRKKWWRGLMVLQFACACFVLVVSPARPLWPALTVLRPVAAKPGGPAAISRLLNVYEVQRARPDVLAPLRDSLPPAASVVGLITGDDVEASLWRPFLHRRFLHVLASDSPSDLTKWGLSWILINLDSFHGETSETLESWLAARNLEEVKTIEIASKGFLGPRPWVVSKIKSSVR